MTSRICILGIIGECGDINKVTNIKNIQTDFINTFINEKILTTLQNSNTTSSNTQSIIAKAVGNIIVSDVNMNIYSELTSDTIIKINESIDNEDTIDNMIETLAKQSIDISTRGTTEPSLSGGNVTMTSEEVNIVNNIKNQYHQINKSEKKSSCISNIINTQVINVDAESNVVIKAINMVTTSKLISKCVLNSITNILSKIKLSNSAQTSNTSNTTSTSTKKGFMDAIMGSDSMTAIGMNVAKDFIMQYWPLITIIIIVAIAVPSLVVIVLSLFGKKKAPVKVEVEKEVEHKNLLLDEKEVEHKNLLLDEKEVEVEKEVEHKNLLLDEKEVEHKNLLLDENIPVKPTNLRNMFVSKSETKSRNMFS
jgi:hypothetical protein